MPTNPDHSQCMSGDANIGVTMETPPKVEFQGADIPQFVRALVVRQVDSIEAPLRTAHNLPRYNQDAERATIGAAGSTKFESA
jgi:hypothetical protein